MKIHILQHVPFEGPGYIADWAEHQAHEVSYTRFYEPDHRLPDIRSIQALIILGGPMDVFAEHIYPWLHPEKAFIEDCIQAGKKVLGICLGAQLAAHCLGAMVTSAPNKEIGWFEVSNAPESYRLPWLQRLFEVPRCVLHWHGDKFHIPYGGSELLRSAGNNNQAFIFGDNVLGLQFHLEATEATLSLMVDNCGDELRSGKFVQPADELHAGIRHLPSNQQIMGNILSNFLNGQVTI